MLPKKISEIIDNNIKIISRKLDFKKDFFGDSPSPFIGRYGYPNVNVGILSAIDYKNKEELDNPKLWSSQQKNISEIVNIRSTLINSRFKSNIYKKQEKLNELTQEIALASAPVEVEVNLKDKPHFKLNTYSHATPTGPNADLEKAKITSNPKINTKVDKVFSDTDLKAEQALNYLYERGIDENQLSQILSVGAVGLKYNRKLVPTRWGITATDDMLGKKRITEIKDFNVLDTYQVYFGGYLGNYYLILFFPEIWSYELFEMSLKYTNSCSTDYEFYNGRTKYSESCEGGYYTVRLAISDKLKTMKKQALALALRFITPEYNAPLGVWVTRESARKALNSKPLEFSSKELMLKYVKHLINKKFNYNVENLLKESILLNKLRTQKKLIKFIK